MDSIHKKIGSSLLSPTLTANILFRTVDSKILSVKFYKKNVLYINTKKNKQIGAYSPFPPINPKSDDNNVIYSPLLNGWFPINISTFFFNILNSTKNIIANFYKELWINFQSTNKFINSYNYI